MTITEAIRARRSIRRFKDTPVTDEQIKTLLEAAMLAPSACNSRPWEFVVVRDRSVFGEIMAVHPYTKMLETADAAIIVCALPEIQSGKVADGFFPQDCAAATENILLQALDLGLGTCWCGVYPKSELVEHIKRIIGVESLPFNIIAVGVPDEEVKVRGKYDEAKVRYNAVVELGK